MRGVQQHRFQMVSCMSVASCKSCKVSNAASDPCSRLPGRVKETPMPWDMCKEQRTPAVKISANRCQKESDILEKLLDMSLEGVTL